MELRSLIIVLLLFSGVMAGLSGFLGDLGSTFGKNTEDISGLSQITNIEEHTQSLEDAFRTKITGIEFIDAPLIAIKGFVEFVSLTGSVLFESWDLFLNSVFSFLYLPSWFSSMTFAIVMLYIIFEIVSAIAKWRT